MRWLRIAALALVACASTRVSSPPPVDATGAETPAVDASAVASFEARTFTSSRGLTLPYRLFRPSHYDPARRYPLLLFLHGAGERGGDNQSQLANGAVAWTQAGVQGKQPAFVVVPQCPDDAQWVDTPWEAGSYAIDQVPLSKPLGAVVELLAALRREFSIDPDRLLVTGLSMGGYGAWDLIERYPTTFAAAMPVCGAGDPTKAALIKTLPLMVFHGGADPDVPPAGSRDMVAALEALGSPVVYTEYPGWGHNAWDKVYVDANNLDWLLAQRR